MNQEQQLMAILERNGAAYKKGIARHIGLNDIQMTNLVTRMVRKGLIVREGEGDQSILMSPSYARTNGVGDMFADVALHVEADERDYIRSSFYPSYVGPELEESVEYIYMMRMFNDLSRSCPV